MKLKDTIHLNWYKHLLIVFAVGLCVAVSAGVTEADVLDAFGNLEQMFGFLSRFLKPDFSYTPKSTGPMTSTLRMSVAEIALGAVFVVSMAFLGTTMVIGNRVVTSAVRSLLDITRTMPSSLSATLIVIIVGIGELTGVMAIAVFTFGLVPQLICEVTKAIDEGPIEAAVSVGVNEMQVMLWFVAPQIMSQMVGYTFYALEVDVRASVVLGYASAGGIGIILNSSLVLFQYGRASVTILLIPVVVTVVDGFSEATRRRLA